MGLRNERIRNCYRPTTLLAGIAGPDVEKSLRFSALDEILVGTPV
jgi:hypothetical protein